MISFALNHRVAPNGTLTLDRAATIGITEVEIGDLLSGGYEGPLSFGFFADNVSTAPGLRAALSESMQAVRGADAIPAR